jgi:YfiR/HmsC-like
LDQNALFLGCTETGPRTAGHRCGEELHLWTFHLKVLYTATFHHNSEPDAAQCRSKQIGPQFACAILLLTSASVLPLRSVRAQDAPTEYQVKAAYLFNFLKFVEWPGDPLADTHGRWIIGIVGDNPFGDELTQIISGKTVQGHELQVRRFQPGEDLHACHILFISASEKKRLPSVLATLNSSSVLTVADMDHFIESGGMIQFVMEDKRVRFAIDVGASGRARLKVSSKLLSLARTVTETERVGNN